MQRRLCEMSEAKWSITEAKCLQISYNKFASQRDAISPLYGNLMLSHSAGMQHPDISIAGISKRFHFASLHYIFSAYLPTHIKFLTEFRRIFFGTTCISFPMFFCRVIGVGDCGYFFFGAVFGAALVVAFFVVTFFGAAFFLAVLRFGGSIRSTCTLRDGR